MTSDVMPFNNLFKIMRVLERENPALAEEIITDASRMAEVVKGDAPALAKLITESTVEITRYLDRTVLENVNIVLSGEK